MKTKIFTAIAVFTLTCLASAQVPNYVPTNGLQGYWPFTGNANDLSGNLYNGTVNGALLTADRFGNPNRAYSFNGTSDYISTNYSGILGGNPRAVSFWAQSTATTAMPAVAWGDINVEAGRFDCSFNYVHAGATIDGANCAITDSTNSPTSDNMWHHYVFQFDSVTLSQVKVYQDGVALTQTLHIFHQNDTINTLNTSNVQFGTIAGLPYFFNGQLDDIGIWNRALTNCEIQQLYTNTFPAIGVTSSATNICAGQTTTLSASASLGYTWSTSSNASQIVVSPTTTSVYVVSATNLNGCAGSGAITVSVNVCTGIPSWVSQTAEILSYPNPTNGFVTISGMQEQTTIEVYNVLGACIYKTISKSDQILIDLNSQPNGIYFIKTGLWGQKTIRIVKEQ